MKNIMLICCAGMSTSLLVTKMNEAAKKSGADVNVFAASQAEVKNHSNVDVVLLGPQVRYLLGGIQKEMEPKGIPVAVIDTMHYGMMNGEAVLKQALDLLQ